MVAMLDDPFARHDRIDRRLSRALDADDMRSAAPLASRIRRLVDAGLDRIPPPGHGATLQRWQALEQVARHDLALVKLYESHTDALAILHEIDPTHALPTAAVHAVWASEARDDPVTIRSIDRSGDVTIDGRKSWCSGATIVDRALMTAVDHVGKKRLVEIELSTPGITIDRSRWRAVGMGGSGSFDVVCTGVAARLVGAVDAYLDRPGFWHGGAGIAACWHGAAAAIGTRVRDLQVGRDDVHALAHLGAIDAALAGSAALLRETAAAIDAAPAADAMRIALRARGAIADVCEIVIHHAGRAMGPGPLCNEADLAQRIADLPIFIRQSRAEHDRVAQSRSLLGDPATMRAQGWLL